MGLEMAYKLFKNMNIRKKTYGINFPFLDGENEEFLRLTDVPEREVKSNLIHLLLTKKGSRYYLPEFGTNLYQYIFEPLDDITTKKIEDEIIDAVEKFMPNLKINKVVIIRIDDSLTSSSELTHQIKINIDYTITSRTFESSGEVTLLF
jgi:phage baseplate assembly protein W